MRLLMVEDNTELSELLAQQLRKAGFEVDVVETREDATAVVLTRDYALVILDLGLPDGCGLDVLRRLRHAQRAVPVLVLTARAAVADRVRGLELGADDYLAKPFAFEELRARIDAILRRPGGLLARQLSLANLSFDPATRQATIDGGVQILPHREAQLLELLLRRPDHVVLKATAEAQMFGLDDEFGSNAIEVYVHRLRKRLEQGAARVSIQTVRGVGYLICGVAS